MPEFNVQFLLQHNLDVTGETRMFNLDKEWTIVCDITNFLFKFRRFVKSVKIQRENIDGEFLVSGELGISTTNWKKNFSQLIKTGTSFIEIDSDMSIEMPYKSGVRLQGFVKITETILKPTPEHKKHAPTPEKIQLQSLECLSNDFQRLLNPNSSCCTDVILKCSDASIPAHKLVLSARSPVFAAMFANPMKESQKNEVDITDIDATILRDLLVYVYTGKTPALTATSAEGLLFAADKYQLQDLKNVCSHFLKDTVSLQSVLRILVLGELHDEDLKSFAMDYICNKCSSFTVLEETEEWNVLRKERSALAMDVLTALVKCKEKK